MRDSTFTQLSLTSCTTQLTHTIEERTVLLELNRKHPIGQTTERICPPEEKNIAPFYMKRGRLRHCIKKTIGKVSHGKPTPE